MTMPQQIKILKKIADLEKDIDTLKQVRLNLATSEYTSATLASNGGSKSYTRADITKVNDVIKIMQNELKQYRRILSGIKSGIPQSVTMIYN